jgi:hypothetical protein
MTSPVPLSAGDIESYTPPSLQSVVPTPTFRFRPPAEGDLNRYHHILQTEGIRFFNQEALRAETFRTLEENWSPDVYEQEKAKLNDIFARMDQGIEVTPDERIAIAELTMRCMDVSPLLRRMNADNLRYGDQSPVIAVGMFVVGWSNIDAPFKRVAGVIPSATITGLARALRKIEEQAIKDKVDGVMVPGMAFIELTTHAYQQLVVDEELEKNSDAPSRSSGTPNGSKTSRKRGGASKAAKGPTSSRRRKTRATPSLATAASS